MKLASILKQRRTEKGLSQFALAQMADVSLATVQNIEAGRGNPEWRTVQALLTILGIELKFTTKRIDWSLLARVGCPLLADSDQANTGFLKSREVLIDTLENLSDQIGRLKSATRESKALVAWLSAIRDHYPSIWNETSVTIQRWLSRHIQHEISPKLRRLALSQLGGFL